MTNAMADTDGGGQPRLLKAFMDLIDSEGRTFAAKVRRRSRLLKNEMTETTAMCSEYEQIAIDAAKWGT